MNGRIVSIAAACALIGFGVGRSTGRASVEFPAPDAGRSAAEVEREVAEALREVRAFPRASRLIRLFEGLTTENVAGAAQAIGARTGAYDPVDLQIFLTAWAHLDPQSALHEVQSWPIQVRRNVGLRTVIREWAATGHALEAGNLYDTLTDAEQRSVAAGPLVRGWALGGDVDGALRLAQRFFEVEDRQDVFDPLARGLLQLEGAAGSLEICRRLERNAPPAFAQRLIRVALNLAAREDPVAAAAFHDELVAAGPRPWLAGSVHHLAGLLRNEDPQRALEWLLPQAEGEERTRALFETMSTWAIRDFEAAWAWFERRAPTIDLAAPTLSSTDATLLSGLVRRMARIRPQEAARYAQRLGPESDRIGMIRRVAYFWAMRDAAAARRWVAGLRLPEQELSAAREALEWAREPKREAEAEFGREDREPDLPDDE